MAENLERIEIEKLSVGNSPAVQIIHRGRRKQEIPVASVLITFEGADGSIIQDIWTRDRFKEFWSRALDMIDDG